MSEASERVVRESAGWPDDEAFERQSAIVDPVFESEDARAGVVSFAAKRAPRWRGR